MTKTEATGTAACNCERCNCQPCACDKPREGCAPSCNCREK